MSAPKLLDLFCCEGGASRGYSRAGFVVYGVDLFRYLEDGKWRGVTRARYPFAAHQGDALVVMRRLLLGEAVPFTRPDGRVEWLSLSDFDAIHASPPCQGYSIATVGVPEIRARWPRLIEPVRELLIAAGLPYVIENVTGARPELRDPVLLCGSMFGLMAQDDDGTVLRLERHRWFESNITLGVLPGQHWHDGNMPVGGVYGGGRSDRTEAREIRRGGYTPSKRVRAALVGINPDEMTLHGLSECLPPAYTEWIGAQLIAHLEQVAA